MALTGQLSDMSLAELIEFFCNQRKTGRLKVDYHKGHGVFFIKEGELVDAKVGALSGAQAVYFALTLPNAAFDFSTDFQPSRRTIYESWTQVVLEGLRRLDEGLSPTEADAFNADASAPSPEVMANEASSQVVPERNAAEPEVPLFLMAEETNGGSKRKYVLAGVAVCVLLMCAAAAIPLASRIGASKNAANASTTSQAAAPSNMTRPANATADPAAPQNNESNAPVDAPAAQEQAAPAMPDPAEAAQAARREREARERERERRAQELAKRSEMNAKPAEAAQAAAPAAGPKTVRVSVAYDEAGRVTQASVVGASPGGEAYAATALRIARSRRFAPGKPGSSVVTVPIN